MPQIASQTDFKRLLLEHIERYPLMQPPDVMKLVYQSIFGGGHMLPSEAAALARLSSEHNSVEHSRELRFELLGDCARVYIDCPLTEEQLRLIWRVFCVSARHFAVGYESADDRVRELLERRLCMLAAPASEGLFAFTPDELSAYIARSRAAGFPAVSHSEVYRAAYSPAYRVIDSRYVRLWSTAEAALRSGTLPHSLPDEDTSLIAELLS